MPKSEFKESNHDTKVTAVDSTSETLDEQEQTRSFSYRFTSSSWHSQGPTKCQQTFFSSETRNGKSKANLSYNGKDIEEHTDLDETQLQQLRKAYMLKLSNDSPQIFRMMEQIPHWQSDSSDRLKELTMH